MKLTIRQKAYKKRDRSLYLLGFYNYQSYLNSDLWKQIRSDVLNRDRYRCTICKSKNSLQVHHLSYGKKVLNGWKLDQLITVCHKCHENIYEIEKDRVVNPSISTHIFKHEVMKISPRDRKVKYSLKEHRATGLPLTLYCSLSATLGVWRYKNAHEFIERWIKRKQNKDKKMLELLYQGNNSTRAVLYIDSYIKKAARMVTV